MALGEEETADFYQLLRDDLFHRRVPTDVIKHPSVRIMLIVGPVGLGKSSIGSHILERNAEDAGRVQNSVEAHSSICCFVVHHSHSSIDELLCQVRILRRMDPIIQDFRDDVNGISEVFMRTVKMDVVVRQLDGWTEHREFCKNVRKKTDDFLAWMQIRDPVEKEIFLRRVGDISVHFLRQGKVRRGFLWTTYFTQCFMKEMQQEVERFLSVLSEIKTDAVIGQKSQQSVTRECPWLEAPLETQPETKQTCSVDKVYDNICWRSERERNVLPGKTSAFKTEVFEDGIDHGGGMMDLQFLSLCTANAATGLMCLLLQFMDGVEASGLQTSRKGTAANRQHGMARLRMTVLVILLISVPMEARVEEICCCVENTPFCMKLIGESLLVISELEFETPVLHESETIEVMCHDFLKSVSSPMEKIWNENKSLMCVKMTHADIETDHSVSTETPVATEAKWNKTETCLECYSLCDPSIMKMSCENYCLNCTAQKVPKPIPRETKETSSNKETRRTSMIIVFFLGICYFCWLSAMKRTSNNATTEFQEFNAYLEKAHQSTQCADPLHSCSQPDNQVSASLKGTVDGLDGNQFSPIGWRQSRFPPPDIDDPHFRAVEESYMSAVNCYLKMATYNSSQSSGTESDSSSEDEGSNGRNDDSICVDILTKISSLMDNISMNNDANKQTGEEPHEETDSDENADEDTKEESDEETVEADIKCLIKQMKLNPSDEADISIWDFAGHYLFYETHHIFRSPRSVYLLVTDISRDINSTVKDDNCFLDSRGARTCNVSDSVEFWLNSTPVILDTTHGNRLQVIDREHAIDPGSILYSRSGLSTVLLTNCRPWVLNQKDINILKRILPETCSDLCEEAALSPHELEHQMWHRHEIRAERRLSIYEKERWKSRENQTISGRWTVSDSVLTHTFNLPYKSGCKESTIEQEIINMDFVIFTIDLKNSYDVEEKSNSMALWSDRICFGTEIILGETSSQSIHEMDTLCHQKEVPFWRTYDAEQPIQRLLRSGAEIMEKKKIKDEKNELEMEEKINGPFHIVSGCGKVNVSPVVEATLTIKKLQAKADDRVDDAVARDHIEQNAFNLDEYQEVQKKAVDEPSEVDVEIPDLISLKGSDLIRDPSLTDLNNCCVDETGIVDDLFEPIETVKIGVSIPTDGYFESAECRPINEEVVANINDSYDEVTEVKETENPNWCEFGAEASPLVTKIQDNEKTAQKDVPLQMKVIQPQARFENHLAEAFLQQTIVDLKTKAHETDHQLHNHEAVKLKTWKRKDGLDKDDVYRTMRNHTWLPLDKLPVPKVDITAAILEREIPLSTTARLTLDGVLKDIAIADVTPGPQITMRFELLRLCTLRNFPRENKPFLIRLAAAGFYYAAEADETICYCCGLRKRAWVQQDKPWKVHRRIAPNCNFILRNSEVNYPVPPGPEGRNHFTFLNDIWNVPDEDDDDDRNRDRGEDVSEVMVPNIPPAARRQRAGNNVPVVTTQSRLNNATSLGVALDQPKHPQYAIRATRLSSFSNNWPDNTHQLPQTMVDAGFYYAGIGDCVRCFYCGIGLRHWTEEDDPWIEHARWSRQCTYMRQVKGEEFINLVHMAIEYTEANEEPTSATGGATNQLPNEEANRILLTDAAQSVLEMGYQPNIIKKAIDLILRQEGRSGISSVSIMERVLSLEEQSNREEAERQSIRQAAQELSNLHLEQENVGTREQPRTGPKSAPESTTGAKNLDVASAGASVGAVTAGVVTGAGAGVVAGAGAGVAVAMATGGLKGSSLTTVKENMAATHSASSEIVVKDDGKTKDKSGAANDKKPDKKVEHTNTSTTTTTTQEPGSSKKGAALPQDPKTIKEENEKLKEQTLCKVCLDKMVCIVFLPCGHLVTCEDCAPAMRKCPVCRALVKGTVKTYMA